MGLGSDQDRLGRVEAAWVSWAELIRRARRPCGARRLAALGRTDSKRSTARRVTTSNFLSAERVSARAVCILMSVNVSARATSRRKVAFLWLDSISVRDMCGAQSLMGMPGNPAPEPRSATAGAKAPFIWAS